MPEGLTSAEAELRLREDGPNEIAVGKPISPFRILLRQFQDLMVLILVAAGVVALAAWGVEGGDGLPADAIVIGAIVILNACLGFVQEFRAEKTVEELRKMAATGTRVVRDGQSVLIDRSQVVRGDLVLLEEGDRVPADLALVRCERLRADESMLTGESVPVGKAVPEELFAGTTVVAGRGDGIVQATGSQTRLGAIAASLTATEAAQTPLERRLNLLGSQIGKLVLALSVLIALVLLALEGRFTVGILMVAVALAVAAVPEGLPAVLTVSLSVGARRLARHRAVVRRMAAVETLGSVTTIVTDKTGTLTHNQMTVSAIWLADGREVSVSGLGYSGKGELSGYVPSLLLWCGVLASTAEVAEGKALGDPTEAALVVLAEKAGMDWRALRAECPELSAAPFSSERARMSSLRRVGGEVRLFVKGSLESLAPRLSSCEGARQAEASLASRGLRTLALAWRPASEGDAEEQECDLELLGLVGMSDPPREDVPEAVRHCARAGIRVVMLTGDHPRTALAVGKAIGLARTSEALTGAAVDGASDEDVDAMLETCDIFARVSPHAKLRLVERLIAKGDVVAMTGDGVNDAPALKKVHVGVAMGSGTAVAIEASELVLLDDDFATLVRAIEGGRVVFTNVQKFVAFLFSGNLGVVVTVFAGTLVAGLLGLVDAHGTLLPLTAAQILWMNLVTDGAPAVAFSLSSVRAGVLDEPPRRPEDPLVSGSLWSFVAGTGAWVAALTLLVLDALYPGGLLTLPMAGDATWARTAAFYTIVTTRLCNAMNFQPLPGPLFSRDAWRDRFVPVACLLSWLLTLAVLGTPSLRDLFGLAALGVGELAVLTLLGPSVLAVGELWKRVFGVRMIGA